MKIKIDYRERDLINICRRNIETIQIYKNIELSTENLSVGDIVIEDNDKTLIIIERKTLADLGASIKDGRYKEQSYRLNGIDHHNHNIIYLIEGDLNKYNVFKDRFDKTTIYSAMFSINYYKGFSLMRSITIDESATIICNMAYKLNKTDINTRQGYYTLLSKSNVSIVQPKYPDPDVFIDNNINDALDGQDNNINNDLTIDCVNNQGNEENTENTETDTVNDIIIPDCNTVIEDCSELSNHTLIQKSFIEESYCDVIKKVKKDNITPDNIGEIMLCQIPGVSTTTAKAVIGTFKTIRLLIKNINDDNTCLNNIIYINAKGQTRRITKTAITNIINYLAN